MKPKKEPEPSKKVQLKLLENDKRFADLELNLGKLEDKFNDVWETIPDIDSRSQHIEDLLNIINLGLINFKEKSDKMGNRVSELEKFPGKIEQDLKSYSEKMRKLDEGLNQFSAKVQALNTVKDDMSKNIREDILPDITVLKSSIERNRASVEQMRTEVENFKSMIRSFQQTLQLLDINSVIQQFDNFNVRIANTQAEVDTIKDSIPSREIYDNDIEIMRNKIQDLGSNVIDTNTKLKEFDSRLQIITDKLSKTNIIGRFNEVRKEIKSIEKLIYSNENKINNLDKNFQKRDEVLGNKLINIEKLTKKAEHLGFIESIREEVQEHAENLEETKTEIEKLASKTEKIYYDMNKKISNFGTMEKEIDKLKFELEDSQKISDENNVALKNNIDLLNKLKKEIKELKDDKKMKFDKAEMQPFKEIVHKLVEKTYELNKKVSEIDEFKDRLESMDKERVGPMKDVIHKLINKNAELEKKIQVFKKSTPEIKEEKDIPKDVINEIMSLKELVTRLQVENNDMKQTMQKIKNIAPAKQTVPPHVVAEMVEHLKSMEMRVNALEGEIRKEISIKPVILE